MFTLWCLLFYYVKYFLHFEVNAVFAADAVARLSGKVGVAAVTAGPGFFLLYFAIKLTMDYKWDE